VTVFAFLLVCRSCAQPVSDEEELEEVPAAAAAALGRGAKAGGGRSTSDLDTIFARMSVPGKVTRCATAGARGQTC
jgi:hypothetical protein